MANVIAENSRNFEFAERKTLAEKQTRFCVDKVEMVTQRDGKTRWYLDIHFFDEELQEVVCQKLTYDIGSKDRDKTLQAVMDQGDFPQHSCFVSKREFKGKAGMQTFYDIQQDKHWDLCACGVISGTTDEPIGELDALDERPF